MEHLKNIVEYLKEILQSLNIILDFKLLSFGESELTVGILLYVIFMAVLLVYLSGKIKKILVKRIIRKFDIHPGTVQSIASIMRYVILTLGGAIIFQSAGIDLSALGFIVGALGVGIGFGLQNITNNFISGMIILFEQPIKVGDRVRVGEIEGDVVTISVRATTVITNDNITLIIPNSEFINSIVTNWSHNDRKVALRFPVGVSYKEDPEKVKKILLDIVNKEEGILPEPPPEVLFVEFGDSSLNFMIRIWTSEYMNRPSTLKSKIYFDIFEAFKKNAIEIPFPQRDLHIKSSVLPQKD